MKKPTNADKCLKEVQSVLLKYKASIVHGTLHPLNTRVETMRSFVEIGDLGDCLCYPDFGGMRVITDHGASNE